MTSETIKALENLVNQLKEELEMEKVKELGKYTIQPDPTFEECLEMAGLDVEWTSFNIQRFCIRHDFYTGGDNEHYSMMLDFVDNSKPTESVIQLVAMDIAFHSYESDGSAFSVYSPLDNVVNNIADAIKLELFGIEE